MSTTSYQQQAGSCPTVPGMGEKIQPTKEQNNTSSTPCCAATSGANGSEGKRIITAVEKDAIATEIGESSTSSPYLLLHSDLDQEEVEEEFGSEEQPKTSSSSTSEIDLEKAAASCEVRRVQMELAKAQQEKEALEAEKQVLARKNKTDASRLVELASDLADCHYEGVLLERELHQTRQELFSSEKLVQSLRSDVLDAEYRLQKQRKAFLSLLSLSRQPDKIDPDAVLSSILGDVINARGDDQHFGVENLEASEDQDHGDVKYSGDENSGEPPKMRAAAFYAPPIQVNNEQSTATTPTGKHQASTTRANVSFTTTGKLRLPTATPSTTGAPGDSRGKTTGDTAEAAVEWRQGGGTPGRKMTNGQSGGS